MPRIKNLQKMRNPTPNLSPDKIDRTSEIGPQIYELVRLSIILNELEPGQPVHEIDICEWFGVSRTPIRDAYKQLIKDGLIRTTSKVGSIVSFVDKDRIREGIIVRRALEREVVRILCEEGADLRELDACLALQQVAVNHDDQVLFFTEDEKFHGMLATLSGIPAAWRLACSVKAHVDRARIKLNEDKPQRMVDAFEQHIKLVEALKDRDTEKALKLIDTHVNSVLVALGGLEGNGFA